MSKIEADKGLDAVVKADKKEGLQIFEEKAYKAT